ncbi:hypothetical protein [Acinetobacter sp. ABJ_C5_2]|uniref:hypothetical protein n=1 Tax=Acinetobacter sp. ABJ_C5_2 TaxID=3376992 RepID=UPI0037C8E860
MLDLENEPKAAPNSLNPTEASKDCIDSLRNRFGTPLFNIVGHGDTTYVISVLAGQDIANTNELTYFSQYPDANKELDAIVNAVKNKIPSESNKFTHDIVTKLHSLHGGDSEKIKQRRIEVENAIKNNLKKSEDIWKAGLLIHALGDTYAHTYKKFWTNEEVAYGPTTGHLGDSIFGEDPDSVTSPKTKIKYLAYIENLFNILKTEKANDQKFQEFKEKAKNSKCKNDACFSYEVLEFDDKMDRYNRCMDKYMTPLSRPQVQEVMDQIKD